MIRNLEHALAVQARRAKQRKGGIARAVRRFLQSQRLSVRNFDFVAYRKARPVLVEEVHGTSSVADEAGRDAT